MSDLDEHTSTEWENLVEVGNYPTLAQAHEHALVVLAMRQPCWVSETETPGGFTLHAEPEAAPAIARELDEYDREQVQPEPPVPALRDQFRHSAGWGIYAIWALTLIVAYLFQLQTPWLIERASSSSIDLIANHEWWRPFTALFLHADAPHLIGNLLGGMFFGTLVARSIGPLRGWALILASGTAGNAITSAIAWPEPFISIGASTAVFGALGILSGLGFTSLRRNRAPMTWLRIVTPVLAGIVILGWLGGGTPGDNTDVLGHILGFGSGLAVSLVIGHVTPAIEDEWTDGNAGAARGERT